MNINDCKELELTGDLNKAELCYRKLLKKEKISLEALCNLGIICAKTGRDVEANNLFKRILYLEPKSSMAYNNLGLIFINQKKYDEAINNFLLSLKFNKNTKTYFNLALAYEKSKKIKKSIYYYKEALKIDSNNAGALSNLGNLYYASGDLEKAKRYFELSIKTKFKLDAAYNNLGLVYVAYGNFKLAKKNFLNALKINPINSRAHYNLSNLIDYNINGKKHLIQMLKNLKSSKSDYEKMYYCFAIGKAYEDKKKYTESFQNFNKGNLIMRKSFLYSIKEDEELFINIKKNFNLEIIKNLKNLGFDNETPIFIVGMPRSGTSLVEQILSSHPEVFGAGEINDLENVILEFFTYNNQLKKLKNLSDLDHNTITLAGRKYCSKLKNRSNNSRFIINKLTLNFRWIGLIKLILPKAIIIHCKRHPADTSLSIYQKLFPLYGNEYTFDLLEIAKYYVLYIDLMNYWRKIFPNGFYEIDYENLITDQKNQIIKLLNYCKLSLNKKCFNFSNTHRAVRTSSDMQVRKKIYTSSLDKWKIYKKELNNLFSILNIDS